MRTTLLLLAALFTGGSVAAQASISVFGTPCVVSSLRTPPTIGSQGLPKIGQTFRLTYSGPNFTFSSAQQIAQPFLVVGLPAAFTVPNHILPQQATGCMGYTTTLLFFQTPFNASRTAWVDFVDIRVPNDPNLVGANFVGQWMVVFQQCGFAGCNLDAVMTSDAAAITVGT